MTTHSWVQVNGKLVPKAQYRPPTPKAPLVMADIAPFVSPIDGKIITTRPQRNAHMRQHGVTRSQDYSTEFLKKKRLETHLKATCQTPQDKRERIAALKHATEY